MKSLMLVIFLLLLSGSGNATPMSLQLKWLPGSGPHTLNLKWSFQTNQGNTQGVVVTRLRSQEVANFEIRINSDNQTLNFVINDRSNTHPRVARGPGFQVKLPNLPTAWYTSDKLKDSKHGLQRLNTWDFKEGHVLGVKESVYLFDSQFRDIHGLFVVRVAGPPSRLMFARGQVVPEPGTALLLGLGLIGLSAAKSREFQN